MKIGVVVPACDEELTIEDVVRRCQKEASRWGTVRTVVSDNDSSDATAEAARQAGAEVVSASPRGYGRACLRALDHLGTWPDVLVFIDADGSSLPEEMDHLLSPIGKGGADLVIGCRPPGSAMTWPQKWGSRLAVWLIRLRWGYRYADMGPYRAIRRKAYQVLGMTDTTWGWTVEMQILAVLKGIRTLEVPVSWEKRLAGRSKISGTLAGVVRAGGRILWTIARYAFRH